MVWTREEEPLTRGKHRQSRPFTRTMHRLDVYRKLKFTCGCCADSEKPANRRKTSTSVGPKSHLCFVENLNSEKKNTVQKKSLAHKINQIHSRKSCSTLVVRSRRDRLRNGLESVKKDVSVPKQTQGQTPAAACAGNPTLTSSGDCNRLPLAFACSNRSAFSEYTPKTQNRVYRDQQQGKINLWEDFFPKVTLCDIGPICVECKHKCSFALPDNVNSKLCFKEEMRAGFRYEPGCLSQKKQSFHESVPVKNNGELSRSDSEINLSQLTNVSEQNDVTSNTNSGAVADHVQNQDSVGLTCFAEQPPKLLCINGMQSKFDSRQNILGNESLVYIKPGILSEVSSVQNGNCMDSPLSNSGFSDTLGSVHCMDSPKNTEEQPLKPNGLTLDKTNELNSFTCQRVRVYSGKKSSSCARTYLTWPLSSRKSATEDTENEDCRAGHLSLFQISQSFEPADPNQHRQLQHSLLNKGVGASSDVLKKKKKCPSYSSQQSVTILQKLGSFLATPGRRQSPVQIKESPSLIIDKGSSTPSPSTLCLIETSSNIFSATFPETNGVVNSVSSSQSPYMKSTPNACDVNLPQTASLITLDLNDSCDSSSLLPQDMAVSQDETLSGRGPPELEPYFKSSPLIHKLTTVNGNDSSLSSEKCSDTDLLLPPLLSPLNSPLKHIVTSISGEYENRNSDMPKSKVQSETSTPEISHVLKNSHAQSCCSFQMENFLCNNDVHKCVVPTEEESKQPLATDSIAPSPASDVSTRPSFSPSNNKKSSDESSSDQDSDCSEMSDKEDSEDSEKLEALDEIDAYEHDILLVDAFQDDSDLFEKVPQNGLLKLGPVRTDPHEPGLRKMVRIMPPVSESSKIPQRITHVNLDFLKDSPEDSPRRSWRPQCNSTSSALQCGTNKQYKVTGSAEGKLVNIGQERTVYFPTENISPHISPLLASRLGPITRTTRTLNAADIRWQKPAYCRNYFSESLNCGFKACRFHHVPMDGDEKFCTETLARFVKNPACLHKAGAVFAGFYQSNKPGGYFSLPVLVSLLWALLKAGMLSDLFSVLKTALAHNIMPEHEFLLELFNFIREKGLLSFVPELMQLIFKMAGAGLPLNLDCLDCVKNTEMHQIVSSNSATALSGNTSSTSEYLNLVHAVVEMELCTKQEDWKRLGKVFQSICQSTQQVNQVERISGRIAVALLSESKDRLTLPFAVFGETAARNVDDDSPVKSYLGRIGVSLMLRYHKTHQWAKGLKVVEVLSAAKISYATMKGLFGNEDCTSRCHVINVATELCLLNNSVEGALTTLRENEWFLMSSTWPCEAADVDNRIHVLLRLAEITSYRDTLEILSNLPGLKEPNGHIDISRYTTFFTAHLQVCLDRQIVPLASDLVDYMLSKGLQVDHSMLQMLLHKLGKQNLWLRAREIFKHSMHKGYHPEVSAPLGLMTLMVPSELGEIELALTYEMFISLNATAIVALPKCTTTAMSITLKRTQSGESDYLSAGSRLLSAACIPQPKLNVRYMAVNSSQEQVFALDIASARRWLQNNHLWANEVWSIST